MDDDNPIFTTLQMPCGTYAGCAVIMLLGVGIVAFSFWMAKGD